jgi:hypothetical protein
MRSRPSRRCNGATGSLRLLTNDGVETLKHLAREDMGENSLRALASDLANLEAWADAAAGQPLPWPATEALALKFVAHHLWDPAKRVSDARHGMPADVAESLRAEGLLRCEGPHAPNTVKWRLASWSTLHRWKEIERPFAAPSLRSALRFAVRPTSRQRERKSKRAVTGDVLDRLIATCATGRLADIGISRSLSWRSRPAGAGAAKWRGCVSSS